MASGIQVGCDVVMPTWNSNAFYFPAVVVHLVKELMPHHLIVVDRHSNDGTQDTVKKYVGDICKLVELDSDLAWARKIGGMLADTDVVCFIDDVLIPDGLRPYVYAVLNIVKKIPKIGAVAFSTCASDTKKKITVNRVIKPLHAVSMAEVLAEGLHVPSRALTFFFRIKRELVATWTPPVYLSAYEDFHLSQHVARSGYVWIELATPCIIHLKDLRFKGITRYIKQGLWEGANAKLVGIPLRYILVHLIGRLVGAIARKKPHQFFTYIGYVFGLIAGKKYRKWKR
jgi:glycosyltransferase involved in cell wall biosynthesis